MSYDSSNLTTPDIKWLGVRPSDLDRFNIPEQCRLPMTEEDLKTGKRLVSFCSLLLASRKHVRAYSSATTVTTVASRQSLADSGSVLAAVIGTNVTR